MNILIGVMVAALATGAVAAPAATSKAKVAKPAVVKTAAKPVQKVKIIRKVKKAPVKKGGVK